MAIQNHSGAVKLHDNCSMGTGEFLNSMSGLTLEQHKNQKGTEETYQKDCLNQIRKPLFYVGGDLNFTRLDKGSNQGGDIYVAGSVSANTALIVHSDFYGIPVEGPFEWEDRDYKDKKK
jgi:hypothetical protein